MATLNVSVSYPDNDAIELRDVLCDAWGYTSTIVNEQGNTVANPETKLQFIQRMSATHLQKYIHNTYLQHKKDQLSASVTAINLS